ncbi:MAG: cupin domain-containing protein [bacterium]|nr:cupin domain-containing protein [bacterium]
MPLIFHQDDASVDAVSDGVSRKSLLNLERTGSDWMQLGRLKLEAGSWMHLEVAATSIAWLQILEGRARLTGTAGDHALSDTHICFLPPGFSGKLETKEGALVLYLEVPDAGRFDAKFTARPPTFRCVDWSLEPVLRSEHDARKRIYFVTPKLFGTKSLKGELIIYPPGTEASNHHHEGAEHFQYIIQGSGTLLANENPIQMRAGHVIYNYEFERHYFINTGDEDLIFVEMFVPAEYRTVWTNPELICAWNPTGRNIKGGAPSREIKAHSSAAVVSPEDV